MATWTRGAGLRGVILAVAGVLSLGVGPMVIAAAPGKAAEAVQPTPRLPDGTIDLGGSGSWNLPYITDFLKQIVGGPKGEAPFLPWTKAMYAYTQASSKAYDPEGFCLPPGGPRAFGTPYPAQFIQQPDRIIIIFEGGAHVWREIHMDGRPHPKRETLTPTYFGHSVGKWEGDTLVVDTIGFNERTWLSFDGLFHTDELHTIERFTRPNRGTLRYEAVIDDPGAYEKQFTVGWNIPWVEGRELLEYICQEENQYLIDLEDDFGEPFFRPTKEEDGAGK
jgi:hypothetical protein